MTQLEKDKLRDTNHTTMRIAGRKFELQIEDNKARMRVIEG